MATTITSGNATNGGAAISSDNTGILELKTGTGSGTTAMTIGTGQQVAVTLGSAAAPAITFSGDTNTGIFSPGADRIGFAEGGAQVGEFDASGNFQFNSGYGSVATAYGCRAWVNFNGTGTVAIRASGNVSSITDNGTGDYTVNFTNALPDVNYAFTGTLAPGSASTVVCVAENSNTTRTASLFRIYTSQQGAIVIDVPAVMISVFR
jgi:hypothetical protein